MIIILGQQIEVICY